MINKSLQPALNFDDEYSDLNKLLKDERKLRDEATAEYEALQIAMLKRLQEKQIEQIKKVETKKKESELRIFETAIKQGIDSEFTAKVRAFSDYEKTTKNKIKEASKEDRKKLKKELKEKLESEITINKEKQKQYKQLKKFQALEDKKTVKEIADLYKNLKGQGLSKAEIKAEIASQGYDEESIERATGPGSKLGKSLTKIYELAGEFAKQLSGDIKDIAYSKSEVDTRLQGSNKKTDWTGSYWGQINNTITGNVAVSPFVKQADVVTNLKTLVGKGIAYNVEQRAFLDTISDKIATTFEATDAALLKLVRIQQQDTTAARLGMESALTAFLNNMYETTEYMTEAADSIRASIYEASALMGAAEATAFEYQIQKWMGSLHSVGFGDTQGLAGAIGKLASGDVSAITEGGYGNLLVMAANKAGLSISEILAEGLNDAETNDLMRSMVEYLGEIYAETKNSNVIAQQYANVYGLAASDLKAAANLATSTSTISKQNLNYDGMMQQLTNMANSLYTRTSVGEMMENMFGNLQYSTAAGIANNPILYATYNIASMLDQVAGGIDFSLPLIFGTGSPQTFNVADIMRTGAVAGGLLSGIAQMIVGIGNGSKGGFSGNGLLKAFGVYNTTSVARGTGNGLLTTTTMGTSSSGEMIGNADGSDIQNKTMSDTKDSANQQLEAQKEEDNETKLSTVDEHVMSIYTLLESVISGSAINVNIQDQFSWTKGIL